MLVLTRKPGESIVIGENGEEIEIKILAVERDAIRLGIDAPRSLPVYRKEIREAIRAENLRAAGSARELGRNLTRLLKK